MSYLPHQALITPARAKPGLIRLLAGVVTLVVGYFALLMLTVAAVALWLQASPEASDWMAQARTPQAVLAQLYSFLCLIGALALTVTLVHRRALIGLVGRHSLAFSQGWRVARALLMLNAVLVLLPLPQGMQPEPHLGLGTWLGWLPFALLGLAIQTGAEELAFRGYLQSQLAARFAHPAVWLSVPSVLFALLHYDPATMGANAWLVVIWAGIFGLATADLTARAGTLGPAIVYHFINNAMAMLFVAPEGAFDGLALFTLPLDLGDPSLRSWYMVDLGMILCSWLAARVALRV